MAVLPTARALTAAAARIGLAGVLLASSAVAAQRGAAVAPASVPPVSMTCPMHPDVVESSAGDCPICRMKLVPVRLETVWACPVHPQVAESAAGKCPIDHRDLVQMTVALTWTCAGHPEIDRLDRATCPDGTPMIAKRTLRPHGNHNPQHGGQFFMAPDNFHHLEGAYPRARVFRLYLYDDYARPLPVDRLKQVKARVVTRERHDAATHVTTELAAFPLTRRGRYLEGRIDTANLPAQLSAKVRFRDDAAEYRFDFTFPAYTKEPVTPLPVARPAAAPATASVVPDPPGPSVAEATPSVNPALVLQPIPDNVADILAQLKTRSVQVGELISRGEFTAVYVPAFQARDLAIALESRAAALTPANRAVAEPAIQQLVRTAWLLDAYGDLGNRQQITEAYALFTSATADVLSAFR